MHISSPYTCVVLKFQTYPLTQCIPFRGRGNCGRRLFEICVPLQIPSQRRSDANSAANPIAYAGCDRSASSGGRLFGSSVLLRRTSPIVYNLRLPVLQAGRMLHSAISPFPRTTNYIFSQICSDYSRHGPSSDFMSSAMSDLA